MEIGESRETVAGTRQRRTCSGSGDSGQFPPQTLLKRPFQKLYRLEINVLDEDVTSAKAKQQDSRRNIQMVRDEDIPAITVS